MTRISADQYAALIAPIAENRVSNHRGQSHVEAWDVRRTLTRIFGFGGWDVETISCEQVAQLEHPPADANGKVRWTVVYRAQVRLTVKGPDGAPIARYEDGATGDSSNQPSLGDAHDQAMKTALSQALKRCAVNLGDQFGLGLYNNGRTAAVVNRTLHAPVMPQPAAPVVHDDEPVMPEPQAAPRDDDAHEVPTEQPAAVQPRPTQQQRDAELDAEPMEDPQRRRMFALFGQHGVVDADVQRQFMDWALGRPRGTTQSRGGLTRGQAARVIRALEDRLAERR